MRKKQAGRNVRFEKLLGNFSIAGFDIKWLCLLHETNQNGDHFQMIYLEWFHFFLCLICSTYYVLLVYKRSRYILVHVMVHLFSSTLNSYMCTVVKTQNFLHTQYNFQRGGCNQQQTRLLVRLYFISFSFHLGRKKMNKILVYL